MRPPLVLMVLMLGVASAPAATAASHRLAPVPATGQTLSVRPDALRTLASAGRKSEAALTLRTELVRENEVTHFQLVVRNGGEADFMLTPAQVAAATDAGPVRVLTVDDLEEATRRQLRRRAGAQVSSEFASVGELTRGGGGGMDFDDGPPAVSDKAAQAELAAGLAAARASGFRPVRILPGDIAAVPLPVERLPRKARTLTLQVQVNGETHAFQYALTPVR